MNLPVSPQITISSANGLHRLAAVALTLLIASNAMAHNDAPTRCDDCADWNQPTAPFRIFGNTYYIGVRGLSSVLIATPKGLIVLDGALPQSAPLIEANIRALGFRVEDIRYILNSHVHADHAGGIARLQRDSGASVIASAEGATALRAGQVPNDDPQVGYKNTRSFPRVAHVTTIRDSETVSLDGVDIVAHRTPGHTPGSTTWSWKSCDQGQCYNIVYADSLNALSFPGFRFTGGHGKPDITSTFRDSINKVVELPCDILITVHPGSSDLFRRAAMGSFVDSKACRVYANDAMQTLEQRVRDERNK